MIPSKELLSEVLGIDKVFIIYQQDDILVYEVGGYYGDTVDYVINIYELAHKCKEWAYEKGYQLASYPSGKDWYVCRDPYKEPYEGDNTEPEAIFKACEWIMEQTK